MLNAAIAHEPCRVRCSPVRSISNGIEYHGGFLPYCATFLTFSDYMRGAVRLASLSELHVIYVWTHDSVGLGEDGPTHQPVEHYAALRAIPNLWFVRPGDANETVAAWSLAVERTAIGGALSGPVALALTRQKLPTLPGTREMAREGLAPRRVRAPRPRGRRRARADPDRHRVRAPARLLRRRGVVRYRHRLPDRRGQDNGRGAPLLMGGNLVTAAQAALHGSLFVSPRRGRGSHNVLVAAAGSARRYRRRPPRRRASIGHRP